MAMHKRNLKTHQNATWAVSYLDEKHVYVLLHRPCTSACSHQGPTACSIAWTLLAPLCNLLLSFSFEHHFYVSVGASVCLHYGAAAGKHLVGMADSRLWRQSALCLEGFAQVSLLHHTCLVCMHCTQPARSVQATQAMKAVHKNRMLYPYNMSF